MLLLDLVGYLQNPLLQVFVLGVIQAELGARLHSQHCRVMNCEELLHDLGFSHLLALYLRFQHFNLA